MRTWATRFHGWPEQAYAVLLELGGEPSRETRERVRRHREEYVRQPMIDLLNDLADADPWYEDFAVWRYASTAYWWQNQCATVRVAGNIEIGFCLQPRRPADPGRLVVRGSGADRTVPDGCGRGRERARAGRNLVTSLAADEHEIRGDVMKRVPRGYPADHPRADLLKHRSLIAARELESDTVRDVGPVYRACERLRPLLDWLMRAHGRRAGGGGCRSGLAVRRSS